MTILLAIPFFIITIIMGFWAKKNPTEKSFNRFVFIALTITSLSPSLFSGEISIIQSCFTGALSFLYMSNLIENKLLKKLFEISALAFMLFAGFTNGISYNNLAIIAAFVVLIYYCLNNFKTNISLVMVNIIPLGIAGLYFATNLPYMLAFMALFGCGRYFVETKAKTLPVFYLQSFLAVITLPLISLENAIFIQNIIILLAGVAFLVICQFFSIISKNKELIINRIFNQQELPFVFTIKILFFNISSIALAFVYTNVSFISIYILIAYIAIIASYNLIKMWYLENEYHF